ncbi:hypothetical protein [Bacillus thuringiensis]|uniref:hypothetical protein n=1 Tax=Bacillus thuringiensis TaxID=1428 RepID=UPI00159BDE9F|nr:hypothetical protein [Bacillus thuringiensis]
MSNWLFALCMIVVASILNVIVSFFIKGGDCLRRVVRKVKEERHIEYELVKI